jgi:carbonic anhydrase
VSSPGLQEASYLKAGTQLDLQQLLPSNTTYMAYGGSLTTPPCSEGVTWLVLLNTQTLSLKQVGKHSISSCKNIDLD